MKSRTISISLVVMLALSVGLIGCGGEEAPETTEYNLTISSTEGGSVVTPGEGTGSFTYDEGEAVDLVAVADEGYQFVNWTGDVSTIVDASAALTTITVLGGYCITANFAKGIWDWYDLHAVRNDLDGSYVLMNNLDSGTAGYAEVASSTANGGKGWQPIGRRDDPFIGFFDGQRHEIGDLLIERSGEDWVGLFGCIGRGGAVENLGLAEVIVIGNMCVGGLVGQVYGGTVRSCQFTGKVAGDSCVAGLVGLNSGGGIIQDTSSTCSVSGHLDIGGLVGENHRSTVGNSYSSGSVCAEVCVGGLIGYNIGTLSCSYSAGDVTGSVEVGGLVGNNYVACVVTDCYSSGSVAGDQRSGGLVGVNDGTVANSFWDAEISGCAESDGGTAKTTSEMRDVLTFSRLSWDLVAVGDTSTRNPAYVWNIVDGQTYPFLSWEPIS